MRNAECRNGAGCPPLPNCHHRGIGHRRATCAERRLRGSEEGRPEKYSPLWGTTRRAAYPVDRKRSRPVREGAVGKRTSLSWHLAGRPTSPRLARNGLIERLPGKNRYVLTRDGLLFAHLYTKIYDHVLRPLMATDRPNAPPELLAAIDTLDQIVAESIAHARVPTAA